MAEFVPGYEASSWYGVGIPKATPAEIVDKLNKEINAGLADPKIKARLADLGGDALPLSPADFRTMIADDTEKWAKVIRAANIKRDEPDVATSIFHDCRCANGGNDRFWHSPAVRRCPLLRPLVGVKWKCCERHQFDAPDPELT